MRTCQNTLYVTTQGSYLARDGETVLVRVEHETRLRVPIHTLGAIVAFGQVSCSPPLMALCAERGVTIAFLTEHGRFLARVEGPVAGNVLLRREQYRRSEDDAASAALARAIVAAKVANSRTLLLRALRDHEDTPESAVAGAAGRLSASLAALRQGVGLDEVRGIEGDAGRVYFSVFDHLITAQKDGFQFTARSRRPPLDPINALLSFLYTLLLNDVRAALETVGLDPQVGYLHRDRPGRPGLALDLVEEHRSWLADRVVLSLVNRQQVRADGFHQEDSGGVVMDDATRKQVIVAWQERKAEELTHPFLDERMTAGMVLQIQARLLSRHLRGDLDAYPPFVWR
jgi:CRISPR-associated protein Cas1